jgi:hypothetical protein
MKISEIPISLTSEDIALINEVSATYCERMGIIKDLFEPAASLFNKTFEQQPGNIPDVDVTPYIDGLVFRTARSADRAHFYAILQDKRSGSWKAYHIDFEAKFDVCCVPLPFMPFVLHIAQMSMWSL